MRHFMWSLNAVAAPNIHAVGQQSLKTQQTHNQMHFLQTQSTARRGNRRTSWGIGTVARTAPKGTPTLYRWPSSLWKRSQSNSSDFYRTCPSGNRPDPGGGRGQEKSLDEKARGKSSSFLSLRGSRRGWGHNMKDGFHISRCSSIYFPSPQQQLSLTFCSIV